MIGGLAISHNILLKSSKKYNFVFNETTDIIRNHASKIQKMNQSMKNVLGNKHLPVKFGEKEILNIGLIVAGASTLLIPFIKSKEVFFWVLVLFMTRVGASFIETMTNIYFYKKIHKEESDVIVLFNSLSRISLIFVSMVAIFLLQILNLPLYSLFIFASLALFAGLIFGSKIKDTL